MKNNIFFKTTLILLIGGCITKFLGLIIKVYITRILGKDGISLYSLVMHTYSLLLTLANFNIMLSVSKRISESKYSKNILCNACFIMFILNTFLILFMLFFSKFISLNLLKNKDTFYPLLACSLTLPFVSIGYIIKGYFYGKQNVMPHMISNIIEQLFRLFIILLFIPKIIKYGVIFTVTFYILLSILNESLSIIIFIFFLPKNKHIYKEDLKLNISESKELLKISIPSMSSRIFGNICYFLEPVILCNILLSKGMNISYITEQYGIYNMYAISTLLFPSFFITAISNSLLPEISKLVKDNNIYLIKKRIKESLLLSLLIGFICTFFIFIFRDSFLLFLYKNTLASNYIKYLAPFFVLFYLEGPLSTILLSLNRIKLCTKISIIGNIIKLFVLSLLSFLGYGIYSLLVAEIINILFITLLELFILRKIVF